MDEVKGLLEEVIKTDIQKLSSMEPGSDEKSKAVEDLTKLYKLRIEEIKAENAHNEEVERNELDRDKYLLDSAVKDDERVLKEAQHKSQIIDRWVNVGLQAGLTLGSILAYDIWNRRGLKFEETGTITSSHTRNLLSRMLPSLRK